MRWPRAMLSGFLSGRDAQLVALGAPCVHWSAHLACARRLELNRLRDLHRQVCPAKSLPTQSGCPPLPGAALPVLSRGAIPLQHVGVLPQIRVALQVLRRVAPVILPPVVLLRHGVVLPAR